MSGEVYTMLGYLTGSLIAQQRNARKPVAYQYNGVRLPPLPEWDKTVYPYAAIYFDDSSSAKFARIWFATKIEVSTNILNHSQLTVEPGTPWRSIVWVEPEETVPTEWGEMQYYESASVVSFQKIIWSNADLYNPDGTLFLAESEPVPVYE